MLFSSRYSYHCLHIGPHHVGHTTDLCEVIEVIHRGFPFSNTISQALNSHIQADFIPVFEAVRYGFSGIVDPGPGYVQWYVFRSPHQRQVQKNGQTESVAHPLWADVLCLESPSTLENGSCVVSSWNCSAESRQMTPLRHSFAGFPPGCDAPSTQHREECKAPVPPGAACPGFLSLLRYSRGIPYWSRSRGLSIPACFTSSITLGFCDLSIHFLSLQIVGIYI